MLTHSRSRPVLSCDKPLSVIVQEVIMILKKRRKGTSIGQVCDLISRHGQSSEEAMDEIELLLDQNFITQVN